MKYPRVLRLINQTMARIAGVMIFVIGILAVFEAVMRTFFSAPTSWSLDISTYLLIWAVFLGSAYAFQEKGHVAVDLLRDAVEKRWSKAPRRVMAFIGYAIALVVLIVLMRAGFMLAKTALDTNQLTYANAQIPAFILWLAVVVGSVMMVITVVFIILDLFTTDEKYL